ncbi:MAG TPA: MFS transporter [Vicinamibacteria bacterium]|nr:MFS transporter [Vicinamibacteria bacterium]
MFPGLARFSSSFRALRHRNFRLFLGGQIVSLTGTWMQQVALGWLVYRLTRSAFLLGLVGFAGQIPSLLLAPFAGLWVDRWSRHRMIVATQALSMLQAVVLAGLVLGGVVRVGHVVALSLFIGVVNAFDVPARQSFLVEMVGGREDLANAIALNSSTFNAARLVGPSVAGAVIAAAGEGWVFLLNAVSYVAVIAALLSMRLAPRPRLRDAAAPVWRNLEEGIAYVTRFAPIRAILLLLALVSLTGAPYAVLLPVFAADVLKGDAHTLGFLVGAVGVGALCGALLLAARKSVRGLARYIVAAVAAFGASLVAFSLSQRLWLSLVLVFGSGFALMVHMASSNTIVQTLVDDDKRGRVMSFYAAAFMGTMPLGSLLAGSLAGLIGAPHTLQLGGAACLLGALAFARALPGIRAEMRPIYVRLGIVPEMATGLQTATEPEAAGGTASGGAGAAG